jgi:hypothetical protein
VGQAESEMKFCRGILGDGVVPEEPLVVPGLAGVLDIAEGSSTVQVGSSTRGGSVGERS